jgi:hypothetical protein
LPLCQPTWMLELAAGQNQPSCQFSVLLLFPLHLLLPFMLETGRALQNPPGPAHSLVHYCSGSLDPLHIYLTHPQTQIEQSKEGCMIQE